MIIPNPCKGVCKFSDKWVLCMGCARTRYERAKWIDLSDEVKLHVIEQLEIRKEIFKKDVDFVVSVRP